MKVQELIDRLNNHPNKDAEIILKANLTNVDVEDYDVDCILEILLEDDFAYNTLEILVSNNRLEVDKNESIDLFLDKHDKIYITLDANVGIIIKDDNGGVLRELELKQKYLADSKIEIIKKLQQIL